MLNLSVHERKVLILGLLSLLVAIVTYGALHSSGTFNNDRWNLGGAIVGYLASLLALDRVYGKTKSQNLARNQVLDGHWWEMIYSHEQIALSHVIIEYSVDQQQVIITGEAYTENGKRCANWHSSASCFNNTTMEFFYFWEGDEFSATDSQFSGIGLVYFTTPRNEDKADSGTGWYTTGNILQLQVTAKQKIEMLRLTPEECQIMKSSNAEEKMKLVAAANSSWRKQLVQSRVSAAERPPVSSANSLETG